jgi:hypothetical protein
LPSPRKDRNIVVDDLLKTIVVEDHTTHINRPPDVTRIVEAKPNHAAMCATTPQSFLAMLDKLGRCQRITSYRFICIASQSHRTPLHQTAQHFIMYKQAGEGLCSLHWDGSLGKGYRT